MNIKGLLGIVNLKGVEHLLVLIKKGLVCRLPHKASISSSLIYEVQQVELIPFFNTEDQMVIAMRDNLKRFIENSGFYFSYTLDLTCSSQLRDQQQSTPTVDKRYMWNYKHYQLFRTQNLSYENWIIPMIKGFVGHA